MLHWLVAGNLNVVKDGSGEWNDTQSVGVIGTKLLDALNDCELVDQRFVGPLFTWTNFHKLDRVLVKELWLNMLHDSSIQLFPHGLSNHAYSITKVYRLDL